MGTREPAGAQADDEMPSLQAAGTRIAARALDLLGTRVALAGVELREARAQLVMSLLLVGGALGAAMLALLTATLGIVAFYWDTHRYAAIIVLTLVYVLAALLAAWRFRRLAASAPPLLGATIDQLRRDARVLHPRDEGSA
jgi:uncharacterized membrane protein YqjE